MLVRSAMISTLMRTPAVEFDRISPELAIWHRYDPHVKAELFSSAVGCAAGVFLVDPIELGAKVADSEFSTNEVVGIMVTNENHERASAAIREQFAVPIYADVAAGIAGARSIVQGISPDLDFISVPGAPSGEFALHCSREGGTLIIGDALINFGSSGFAFLPAKYCEDAKLMRRSLRKLLDYEFKRILFAHGSPICSNARERLAALFTTDA